MTARDEVDAVRDSDATWSAIQFTAYTNISFVSFARSNFGKSFCVKVTC